MRAALGSFIASPRARFFLGVVLGFFFLALAVRGVDWSEVWGGLQQADALFIALALMITLANISIKIVRWIILLFAPARRLRTEDISASFMSAQLLNSLFPLRVGDVSRVTVMGNRGADHGFVVGTILIEKYLDTLAFGLLTGLAVLILPLPGWLVGPVRSLAALILLSTLAIVFFSLNKSGVLGWAQRISQGFGGRAANFIPVNLQAAYSAFQSVQKTPNLLLAATTTLLIWLTALGTNQALFSALDFKLPFEAALLSLLAITAGLSLPALPGKVGVFEYACVLALGQFGIDQSRALSYGILLHVIVYLPVIVFGLLSFQFLQIKPPGSVRIKPDQAE